MDYPWLIAYLVLAGAAVVQSLLVALQAWEHRRHGRSCLRNLDRFQTTGRCCVLVPCKGSEADLEENLRAVMHQDYHDYEVTFIVQTADDPACEAIRRVMADGGQVASRLLVAGRATSSGQKVHNLLAATAKIPSEIAFLAFLDSDSHPRPEWLRLAIARLDPQQPQATTGYRWFVPRRATLANYLLTSINCSLMALSSRRTRGLVWGGSWAIRREAFEQIGLREAWQGTLSDDLVASRTLGRRRFFVRFEPGCVVASPMDYSPREMFSFLRRQYLIARHYVPSWWWFALVNTTIRNLAWLVSLGLLGSGLMGAGVAAWVPGTVLAVLYGLDIYRGRLIQDLAEPYLGEASLGLRGWLRIHLWLGPAAGLVHWLGILSAAVGRSITWRGIHYRLARGGKIAGISHDGAKPAIGNFLQPQRRRKAA